MIRGDPDRHRPFQAHQRRWGHAAGDAALLHFVAVLRLCLRELDQLGRLGGEEFCALLPHTGLKDAAQVAERMRAALQSRRWSGATGSPFPSPPVSA